MANDAHQEDLARRFIGPSGFKALDIGIPEPRYPSWRWFITGVGWGRTDRQDTMGRGVLSVDFEEAIPEDSMETPRILKALVAEPLSFRVQDEGEMTPYWHRRQIEGAPVTDFYEIETSHYLHEMRFMTLLSYEPVKHFLFLGGNQCVDIIGDDLTTFELKHIGG